MLDKSPITRAIWKVYHPVITPTIRYNKNIAPRINSILLSKSSPITRRIHIARSNSLAISLYFLKLLLFQ